jgi:hypothetical protein
MTCVVSICYSLPCLLAWILDAEKTHGYPQLCMLDRITMVIVIQPASIIYFKTGISKLEGRAYFSSLIASAIWR